MTMYNDTLNWSDIHQYANLLPNWTVLPILTLLPNFLGFHKTLQRVRLANRGRLLLAGPVPFGTCICSNVETILSWTCHVYGPVDFRTSPVLLFCFVPPPPHLRHCIPSFASPKGHCYSRSYDLSCSSSCSFSIEEMRHSG